MADSRTLIDRARIECQNHWFIYNEKMSVESLAQAVSNLAIQFGDSDDDGGAMVKHFHVYSNKHDASASHVTILITGLLQQSWQPFLWCIKNGAM